MLFFSIYFESKKKTNRSNKYICIADMYMAIDVSKYLWKNTCWRFRSLHQHHLHPIPDSNILFEIDLYAFQHSCEYVLKTDGATNPIFRSCQRWRWFRKENYVQHDENEQEDKKKSTEIEETSRYIYVYNIQTAWYRRRHGQQNTWPHLAMRATTGGSRQIGQLQSPWREERYSISTSSQSGLRSGSKSISWEVELPSLKTNRKLKEGRKKGQKKWMRKRTPPRLPSLLSLEKLLWNACSRVSYLACKNFSRWYGWNDCCFFRLRPEE